LCVRNGVNATTAVNKQTENTETTLGGGATLVCTPQVQKGEAASIQWACDGGVQSGAVGFNTNGAPSGETTITPQGTQVYELQCGSGSKARCTVVVGAPKAEIEVSPASVNLGGRARLYWTSEAVKSCVVEGAGMKEEGTSGAATTPAIYDLTEFTVTCTTAEGEKVSDKVIVDVGL